MSELVQRELPAIPAATVATPAQLLEIAVRQDADIDKLERLMAMAERWQEGEARKAFSEARARMREHLPTIRKDATVDFTYQGKRTYYKHASLAGAMDQLRPVLAQHGFDVSWRTQVDGPQIVVTCVLSHSMGHSEETALPGKADDGAGKNAIQAVGSTVTYLQRYTLMPLLGVAAAVDDDGQESGAAVDDIETQRVLSSMQAAAEQGRKALGEWWAQTGADAPADLERIRAPAWADAQAMAKRADAEVAGD